MDRERERGAARSDVASLWIDFVLLPQKLEEHLAAGNAAIPTPPELISMFLEQALVSHKSVQQGNNSSANGLANGVTKEAEPEGAVKMTSRTASVLCERAARVAVVMRFTLSDIESSILAPLHQFVLLKALIRHDRSRSLLHECNFHRWLIHKALESHPVGSASPNVVLPVSRLGSWIGGNDPGEVLHGVANGTGDPPPSTGDPRSEEERPSVEFLERILREDITQENSTELHTDSSLMNGMANGGSVTEQVLGTAYKCQVILDVGEVHFMRGRIKKAHERFSKCGEMLSSLSVHDSPGLVENGDGLPVNSLIERSQTDTRLEMSPVPKERLAGFLVACKMLLGSSPDANGVETTPSLKHVGNPEPRYVGVPSPVQWAIISSEQSRYAARKYGSKVTSQSVLANGDSGGSDFSSGKENGEASMSGRTSTDMMARTLEDSTAQHRSTKKRPYQEEVNGDVIQTEGQLEKEEGLSGETVRRVKGSGHKEANVGKMNVDEFFLVSKGQPDHLLLNGDEGRTHERKDGEVQEVDWDRQTIDDSKNGIPEFLEKQSQMSSDIVESEEIAASNGYSHEVDLFVDLKSDPADKIFPKLISDMKYSSTTVQEKRLVQAFVEDILKGHLSWGYCLAVERDPLLSRPVRSKLAACNVVRSVLEGAPAETFLRTRGHFENSEESVEFLMQLLLAIKVMHEGDMLSLGSSPCGVDSRQNGRLEKLAISKQSKDIDVSAIPRRVHDLAMYSCCVIDRPWCWACALKLGLVAKADIPKFLGQLPQNTLKDVEGSGIFLKADTQQESLKFSLLPNIDDIELISEREILLSFVQAKSINEIEALVGNVRKLTEKVRAQKTTSANDQCSSLEADVSAILRRRGYNALEIMNDPLIARRLYGLALTFQPRDCDSAMMLWLLETCTKSDGQVVSQGTRDLPKKVQEDVLPNAGLLGFVILQLIEKELWVPLCEFCKWAASLILTEQPMLIDGEQQQGKNYEKEALVSSPGVPLETAVLRNTAGWQLRHKRLLQTLNIARTVVDLMPLCVSLQTAVSRNHFNEDVARLGSTLSNLFEEFLCFLVGIESEGHTRGSDDTGQWRTTQVGLGAQSNLGSAGVAFISKVSNPRVLMALASLTAGWLQRCHLVGLTLCPLAVERYGVLAGVTAGASLPPPVGSLPYPAAVMRPVPPRVSPEFGRDLFGVLLEGIVGLPGVVEGDREKGHRWLQGLADLAFEDEAYVKALRLYLQAGAIRSAQYCDRASSMKRDIFTPWVIQRMVAACRSIGAGLQAAVLCQCLPVPDHESAFRILRENTLIMDRDAAAYFECIWEVPILELLVHLHSRAGDEARVAKLIGLLQQPALNVHNPSSIRQAHISTMEQRFLQRFPVSCVLLETIDSLTSSVHCSGCCRLGPLLLGAKGWCQFGYGRHLFIMKWRSSLAKRQSRRQQAFKRMKGYLLSSRARDKLARMRSNSTLFGTLIVFQSSS